MTILLRALFNNLDPEFTQPHESTFKSLLFYINADNKPSIKIEHSRVDRIFYERVISNTIDAIDINKCNSNIIKCYRFYMDALKNISEKDKKTLLNRLLRSEDKILVGIDIEANDDDEQAIFDTINSAGVRLSSADIIKNAIFQRGFELFTEEEVENLYKEYWESVFENDEDTKAYWNTERITGRLKRDNIEILLHSIAIIKDFFDPDKHNLSELSSQYKQYISKNNNNSSIDDISNPKKDFKDFLIAIKDYATLYREKFIVFSRTDVLYFDDYQKRLLHILNVLNISTLNPYILYLFYKTKDKSQLIELFKKIENFVVRRAICKWETKSYNKRCKELIINEKALSKLMLPLDEEIRHSLHSINNENAKLLLFWIELHRRYSRSDYNDIDNLNYNYSLEHIMPKKWEKFWSNVPVTDENGAVIEDPIKAKEYRNLSIYKIGNMTLLKSKLNTVLSNYDFVAKMNGDGKRKKGIKDYAELLVTQMDIVKSFDNGDIIWNETKIRERTQKIIQEILTIWS